MAAWHAGTVQSVTMTTSDLDQARSLIRDHFYSHAVDVLSPAPWRAEFHVATGDAVTVGDCYFGADVRMRFGDLGAYHVDVPLTGELVWRQAPRELSVATPTCAAVFQPVGECTLERWSGDCQLLAVKIEQEALERELAAMLDAPVVQRVMFAPTFDLSRGEGASWLRLLKLISVDAREQQSLLHHPEVGDRLRDSVITGLLLAGHHQYRPMLDGAGAVAASPRAVRRVVEAVRADPQRAYTIGELARIALVSRRSLQYAFQRHLGTTPMAYLRDVRLELSHEMLRDCDPAVTTVADVAYRSGFAHLGRFAAAYRTRFGVSPSTTLRS